MRSRFFMLLLLACACDVSLDLTGPAARTTDGGATDGGVSDVGAIVPTGDAALHTCAEFCDKLVSCTLVTEAQRAQCVSECQGQSNKAAFVACTDSSCDTIQACGSKASSSSGDPFTLYYVSLCQHGCDDLLSDSCISAAEHNDCRAKCSTAPASSRDSVSSCVSSASGNCAAGRQCLAPLGL